MSFNPNIPTVNDQILVSYQQLRANFQQINSSFSSNHVGLTQDVSVSGMHKVLTTQPQNADPATSSTEVALYNKLVTGIPQLFYRPANSATPIQLTYSSLKADSSASQYSFIAGPFIIYGGNIENVSTGQTITLTPTSTLLFVDLTMANNTFIPFLQTNAYPVNITGSSFTIGQTVIQMPFNIMYFAIGQ